MKALRARLLRDRWFGRLTAAAALLTALSLLLVLGFLLVEVAPLLDPRALPARLTASEQSSERVRAPTQILLDSQGQWDATADAGTDTPLAPGWTRLAPFDPGAASEGEQCFEPNARRWCVSVQARGSSTMTPNTIVLRIDGEPIEQAELIVGEVRNWLATSDGRAMLVSLHDQRLLWISAARNRSGALQLLARPALTEPPPSPVLALRLPGRSSEELLSLHADGRLGLIRPGTRHWRELRGADPALLDGSARLYSGGTWLARWQSDRIEAFDLADAIRPGLRDLWRPQSRPGQPEPGRLWQAQASGADASTHLNLWPLVFGSLKAALLGVLIAIPLALGAAMHAVQYRSAQLRHRLKTAVELCESVPTVILGLLALLWLAPWLERNLGLVLGAALGWLMAFLWPARSQRSELSDLWRGIGAARRALLGLGGGALAGALIEAQLPGGQLTLALSTGWGIEYRTFNGLVVGLMVGLALTPGLYSLADEALQASPAGLQEAALALGASRRDTLFGLLLPAAAPGLLAACLIAFGRGLGETLIVLMVSANTPLTDLNPFSGLRSISATLVLEAPQAVPGTLHYQALLLAALLLTLASVAINLLARRWLHRKGPT
jgi:phosphate transport system permease protein